MKKVAMKYARDKDILLITPLQTNSESKYNTYFFSEKFEIFGNYIHEKYLVLIFQMNYINYVAHVIHEAFMDLGNELINIPQLYTSFLLCAQVHWLRRSKCNITRTYIPRV